jgi:hypothetical protein
LLLVFRAAPSVQIFALIVCSLCRPGAPREKGEGIDCYERERLQWFAVSGKL